MIQTCSNCKNYDISISDEPCRECQKAFRRGEGKPNFIASITNADRIRAMTDEELAEFINDVWDRLLFGNDLPGMCDVCYTDTIQNCKKCWLDWLKEEVTANDS